MRLLDYVAIRQRITIRQVLDLLDYQPATQRTQQWRGCCPLSPHTGHAARARCFFVHLDRHLFHCFVCHRGGNQLDLWATVTGQPLHRATIDLCQRLGMQPILLQTPQPPNPT